MKYNFKKRITATLAITLAAVMFLTIPVSAIEVTGNGSGGGSSSTTNGGSYELPVLGSSTSYCAGYRLTVITADGERRNGTNTIDVYCANSDFASHIKNHTAYYSSGLFYKTQISSGFISGGGTDRDIGNTKFNSNSAIWNSSIPQDAIQMTNSATGGIPYFKTTSGSGVLDDLLIKMGLSGILALENGNKVLIEPIFLLKIANTEYLLTVTEIGLYGFKMFGDIVPASSGNTGSWANIAYYTNAYWPMSCRITENLTYSGTTIWYAAGTLSKSSRGSFGDLVRKGYGVAFAYNNTNPPTIPVDLYPTSVTYWTSQTGGSQVTNLVEGGTYWPRFTFHNNGSIAVNAKVSIWSYPLNKYDSQNKAITIGANSDYTVYSNYSITVKQGLCFGTSGNTYTDYTYTQNTLVYKLEITLNDSKATESNTGNNTGTYTNNFSPIQPSMSQNFLDDENSGSSWISNAVNNRVIYSGEQVKGNVLLKNDSSFKLNIYDWAKAALGLESNRNYTYLNPPGINEVTAWRNSGASWNNITSNFRPKNIPTNASNNDITQKTLYLLSAAGETSYANAKGINIKNVDILAGNVLLNNVAFYENATFTDNGNNLTQSWDNSSRILTLNGYLNESVAHSKPGNINYNFKSGETYKITLEYVSGSISTERAEGENMVRSVLVFDFDLLDGKRLWQDLSFPNLKVDEMPKTITGYLTMTRDESAMDTWIWLQFNQPTIYFNNYKVKVKIERVAGLVKSLAYSTNLEGYSVYPTDLETSEIGLYDADTGKRLNEDVSLKAGQQVYSETTYTNNTDTAVAVSLETKHNNNTNTEYYLTDSADMSSAINIDSTKIPPNKLFPATTSSGYGGTVTWDKTTEVINLNGKFNGSLYFPSIDYQLTKGEKYTMRLEYVGGSITNDTGITFSLLQTSSSGNYGFPGCRDICIPLSSWMSSKTVSVTLEPQPINGSMDGQRLAMSMWCAGENTTFNNYKLKVTITKTNPELTWDMENETLTINGDYSSNRTFDKRELFGGATEGSSSDGKINFNHNAASSSDTFTLQFNGTIYGANYGCSSDFLNEITALGGMDYKSGDYIKISAEYVSGTVTESSSDTHTILALSQFHSNGTQHNFVDLCMPNTNSQPNSYSDTFKIIDCSTLSTDTFKFGLYSYNGKTGADTTTIFNNYTIRIKVERVNDYPSTSEDIISDTISLNDFDNYILKIQNIGGSYIGGQPSIVIEYLSSTNKVVSTKEINISNLEGIESYGISAPNSTVQYFRLLFKSDTGSEEKISYNNLKIKLQLSKKSMTQCNIAKNSNSEYVETCVIAPNKSVTIRSNVFTVSAVPHNHITLSSYIYIKGLINNTEYEYNESNNTKSATYIIETPFKPTVVQANSEYRKGIKVITSFTVKNDSLLDFGTQSDINNIGPLSANLKVYKNSSFTGTPIANVNCTYAVPGHGKATIVWFEWTVPTDSPDKLYAEMICDDNNIYSSSEFADNEDNSKNVYCTFNIAQPKVMSTPDTTFAKKAPYWYEDGVSSASVPSKATGLKSVYNQEAEQIKGSTSWSYYVANGDSLELITETATLMGSSVELIPDGTLSAYVGYDNKWNIKSGYGFKIYTEFKDNIHSTNVQSGYAVFPEFLYKVVDNNTLVNGYTNGAGTRVGFERVLNKYPLCGGEYATYSTFENTKDGKLILPNNDSSHTPTHFIPIWYPNSAYRINCYVADCWTPGGMLSGEIRSSALHINGNMYDDYRVSEK